VTWLTVASAPHDRQKNPASSVRVGHRCWVNRLHFGKLSVVLMDLVRFAWNILRAVLPYPDLPRRVWIRHHAFALVKIKHWPEDEDAVTGADAAQLALLRALYLQRLTHRAVRYRNREEAALLARTAIDNLLVGLYCLYHQDAIKQLTGGEYLALRRITAYLTRDGELFSREALLDAADALGERGHDLNLKEVAEWLNRQHGLLIAVQLYEGYYAPLSHFFQHSSGFALMCHIRPGGKLRHRPAFPWTRRSAARIADGCAGLMAVHVAKETGAPSKQFLSYTAGHLDRTLTPTFVATAKRWLHTIGWRKFAGTLGTIVEFGRYVRQPGSQGSPAEREAHVRKQFEEMLSNVAPGMPEAAFRPIVDELVARVVASMSPPPDDSPTAGDTQPSHPTDPSGN
jgi:hypothetical protein